MKKAIQEQLALPEEVQRYWINTFYDISVDDGGGHTIEISDVWMEERLVEAGLIEKIEGDVYPKKIAEHMVLSQEEAINLDSIAASYSKTLRKLDCMHENITPSTTDAFYVNSGKECYMIEFKNGNWNEKDIRLKVYESIALLNNLKVMDEYAIITDNREKDEIEVRGLNISEKFKDYFGFDDNVIFYKQNVRLLVVYTESANIIKSYAGLCKRRVELEWINSKLSQMELRILRIMEKKYRQLGFGYKLVDEWAMLLLTATSINRNFERFCKIQEMLERMSAIEQDKKEIKHVYEKLNEIPEFTKTLYEEIYKGNRLAECFVKEHYAEQELDGKGFLLLAAKMSVEKMDNLVNSEVDDYKRVIQIVNVLERTEKDKFLEKVTYVCQKIEKMFPRLKEKTKMICDEAFTEWEILFEQKKYAEAIKRMVFVNRILKCKAGEPIEPETKANLLKHVCGMEDAVAQKIVDTICEEEQLFLYFMIIWSYLNNKISIVDEALEDCYIHVMRQMKYLHNLVEGHKDKQKYGVFSKRINEKTKKLTGIEKKERVEEEVQKIRKDIIEGKGIEEIMPLQRIIRLTISKEERAIQVLRANLKGTTLRDVYGCRGIDFSEHKLDIGLQ